MIILQSMAQSIMCSKIQNGHQKQIPYQLGDKFLV